MRRASQAASQDHRCFSVPLAWQLSTSTILSLAHLCCVRLASSVCRHSTHPHTHTHNRRWTQCSRAEPVRSGLCPSCEPCIDRSLSGLTLPPPRGAGGGVFVYPSVSVVFLSSYWPSLSLHPPTRYSPPCCRQLQQLLNVSSCGWPGLNSVVLLDALLGHCPFVVGIVAACMQPIERRLNRTLTVACWSSRVLWLAVCRTVT